MIFMRELDVLRIHAYKSYSLKITYYVWFGDVNHVYFDSVCMLREGLHRHQQGFQRLLMRVCLCVQLS